MRSKSEYRWKIKFLAFVLISASMILGSVMKSTSAPEYLQSADRSAHFPKNKPSSDARLKWSLNVMLTSGFSPAIGYDNVVFYGGSGGNPTKLLAINPDGTVKWDYSKVFLTNRTISSVPSVGPDGTVFFSARDDGKVTALDGDSMATKWEYTGNAITSPVLGPERTIFFCCADNKLHAVDYLFGEKWSFLTTGFYITPPPPSPAIGADGTIYIGDKSGNFFALNKDGTLRWKVQLQPVIDGESAIGADGTIYIHSGGYTYAISSSGTIKWMLDYRVTEIGPMAFAGDGTLYIKSSTQLSAIDPVIGSRKWQYPIAGSSQPAVGADGTIYVGSSDNSLYALNADGTLNWKFATGGAISNCPAIAADGTLYFGSSDGYFYALNTSSFGLANSGWPKIKHDNRNTGSQASEKIFPLPPLGLSCQRKWNRSLLSMEHVNILSWEPNPGGEQAAVAYRIYSFLDNKQPSLLAEVDSGIHQYLHRKVDRDKQYYYAVASVDINGQEGALTYLIVGSE
jgi:outer membrane protein assembly factor BamB